MSFILLLVRFTLLFILVGVTAQAQDLLNGLIVHYPMNGNALDVGLNGLHGSVNGAILGPDQDGNANSAYYFDGVNDFVDFPNDPLLKPQFPFTVACVVRYDSPLSIAGTQVFTTDFEQNNYHGAWSNLSGGQIGISFGGGQGNTNSESRRSKVGTTILNANQWYRITLIVRSALDMDIYIDCVNDGGTYSGTGPSQILYTNVPGCLGRMDADMSGPAHYFNGAIDDFRMWNRALTELEITYLCNQPCISYVSPNQRVCVGDSAVLTINAPGFTGWANASAPDIILSMNTTFTVVPTETTNYLVYSDCGTDTVLILFDSCALDFNMPNVFTPNGDGINDLFFPDIFDTNSRLGLKIYSRWGLLLFQSENLTSGWDGRTPLGAEVPDGTYFWIAEIRSMSGAENSTHGYLTLLR